MNDCSQCSVRERAICQSLSEEALGDLNRIGRRQMQKRGQTMTWQGDESVIVGNVIDGVFKLSASTMDGREQTLGIMFPSDFIGRPFGPKSNHSIVALTDAKVCTFMRAAFDDFARDHPDLEHKLLQRTLTELDRTRQWMLLLGRRSANERVAAFLLEMVARLAEPDAEGPIHLELPLGRQDIADLLGLTIETVSRQMTDMKRAGIIALPNRRTVDILDRDQLACCAEAA